MHPTRRFTMVSGFWAEPDDLSKSRFLDIWMRNTSRCCDTRDVFIVNVSAWQPSSKAGNWLNLDANLGHVRDLELLPVDKRTQLGGWAAAYMLGALIAYARQSDFIYKEQDCLAFGPWVERLYGELECLKAKMLVGRFEHPYQVEQSLTIVKHEFILTLVQEYLAIESDDAALRPELKFLQIMRKHSDAIRFFSFGCGRNRPLDLDAPVFYCQHLSEAELEGIARKGLL